MLCARALSVVGVSGRSLGICEPDQNVRELWGTFSEGDHLREQAFVADLLLYVRLVVPVQFSDARKRSG